MTYTLQSRPDTRPTQQQTYVGWGGTTRTVHAPQDLGYGTPPPSEYGLRRALWDAAFGHVSGFRARDILYYVLTRSLHPRIEAHAIAHEARRHP